ncbi:MULTISPECIES: hypothetical protein [Nocardioides]|nr:MULTISPECIES: hypothetical protein [Nocardioides]
MMVRDGAVGAGSAGRVPTSVLRPDDPRQDDAAAEDEQPPR